MINSGTNYVEFVSSGSINNIHKKYTKRQKIMGAITLLSWISILVISCFMVVKYHQKNYHIGCVGEKLWV